MLFFAALEHGRGRNVMSPALKPLADRVRAIAAQYPTLMAGSQTSSLTQSITYQPGNCFESCLPPLETLVDPLLERLREILLQADAICDLLPGDCDTLPDDSEVVSAVPPDKQKTYLEAVSDRIIRDGVIAKVLQRLGFGASLEGVVALACLVGAVKLGYSIGTAINNGYTYYSACTAWQESNCNADGGMSDAARPDGRVDPPLPDAAVRDAAADPDGGGGMIATASCYPGPGIAYIEGSGSASGGVGFTFGLRAMGTNAYQMNCGAWGGGSTGTCTRPSSAPLSTTWSVATPGLGISGYLQGTSVTVQLYSGGEVLDERTAVCP